MEEPQGGLKVISLDLSQDPGEETFIGDDAP